MYDPFSPSVPAIEIMGIHDAKNREISQQQQQQQQQVRASPTVASLAALNKINSQQDGPGGNNKNILPGVSNNMMHNRGANDSPPTSPPSSEAPPPSDEEFTQFVIRRAAQRLGVDYQPERRISPNRRQPSVSVPRSNTSIGAAPPPPSHGAAHPIDALRAHHWQNQISADELAAAPPRQKFPTTLKNARGIAVTERRLQDPPPPGLYRFAQFMDCRREEIGRMIELREQSLGESHNSVPPLYDVLGDMMIFTDNDTAQAERYYSIALQRLEQRASLMSGAGNGGVAGSGGIANKLQHQQQQQQWMRDATSWTQEVAALQAKLGVLWMGQGRKDAAQAAFLKAAQLANPGSDIATQISGNPASSAFGSNSTLMNMLSGRDGKDGKNGAKAATDPQTAHLRNLLAGVEKDRAQIANALAESILTKRVAANQSKQHDASAAASGTSTAAGGARTPVSRARSGEAIDNDRGGSVAHSDDDFGGGPPDEAGRSWSAPTPTTAAAAATRKRAGSGLGAATPQLATPMRSQSAALAANLHDANSLKRLVDSVTHNEGTEESRRRMRSQLTQLHGSSLSPQRRTVHDTIRKTKDLQDIISRIRNRSDLIPQG